jgi:uncharacterized membrane protein YoaK (UPF0700 family)
MALGGMPLSVHLGLMRLVAWERKGGAVMTPSVWIAVALMVIGAVLLNAGIGAPALWIAAITVGIALVVIDRTRRQHRLGS